MALRAGYYGVKRSLRNKLETIVGTYDETIKSLFPRPEQAVLGAKNILPNNNTTQTINGIPFTKNADGSVTIGVGTASANTSYILGDIKPKAGNYILSRGTTNGQLSLSLNKYSGSVFVSNLVEIGDQAISEKKFTVDYSGYDMIKGFIYIRSGTVISTPFIVYPMIRLASDPDDTYVPYAMANRELTEKVQGIIDAALNANDFAAFKTAIGAITPVTRSLSLTKEDITEEVKEDVEPEKTVTKKRTTKKTEEV